MTHLAGVSVERNLAQDALRRSEVYLAEAQDDPHRQLGLGSQQWRRTPRLALLVLGDVPTFRL
jgi:hypothetical protein